MKSAFSKLLPGIIFTLIISFVYFFKLSSTYNYDSDFGRDINDILKITQGDLTLLGPKLSFGGIHAGPYYYYLFTPAIALFKDNPASMLYLNALIFVVTLGIAYWFLRSLTGKSIVSLLGLLWIATTPMFAYSGRGPGNAFSYLPLMTLLLFSIPWLLKQTKPIYWFIFGVLAGVVINFHLISIVVFAILILMLVFNDIVQKNYRHLIFPVVVGIGIFLSFAPLLLFEITHDFVQFKNTFINHSYSAFTENKNLTNPLTTSTNPIINFYLLSQHFSPWSGIHFLFLFIGQIVLYWLNRKKLNQHQHLLFWLSFTSFVVLTIIARSQLALHYFFPFILVFCVSLFYLLESIKINRPLFIVLIALNLFSFSQKSLTPAKRNIEEYKAFAQELFQTALWSEIDKSSFNVYCARETTLAPLGWEYRYFMAIAGAAPLSPIEFNQAKSLLIIQEAGNNEKAENIKSWELDQFGAKNLVQSIELNNRKIYLFTKN